MALTVVLTFYRRESSLVPATIQTPDRPVHSLVCVSNYDIYNKSFPTCGPRLRYGFGIQYVISFPPSNTDVSHDNCVSHSSHGARYCP